MTAGCRQCLPHRSRQMGDYFWHFSSRRQGAIVCTAWEYRERSELAEPIKNIRRQLVSALCLHPARCGRMTTDQPVGEHSICASIQGLVQVPTSYNRRAWQGVFEGVVRNAALVPGLRVNNQSAGSVELQCIRCPLCLRLGCNWHHGGDM